MAGNTYDHSSKREEPGQRPSDDIHKDHSPELMEKHEVWYKGSLMKSTRTFKHTCGRVGEDYVQETLPW